MSEFKFLFLNAPPRAGKDLTASTLAEISSRFHPVKFAEPLYNSIPVMFGIPMDHWDYLYQNHKEDPRQELRGMTPRKAMIWLSEDVMKPKFGNDVFGHSLMNKVRGLMRTVPSDTIFVASDSGFLSEAVPVLYHFGTDNCMKLNINRPGCTYDGDSRSYWSSAGLHEVHIDNDSTVEDFKRTISQMVADYYHH